MGPLYLGVVALALAAPFPTNCSAEPAPQEMQGVWRLRGNPYRTPVILHVAADAISLHAGCTARGDNFEVVGNELRRAYRVVEIESSCSKIDARNKRAMKYWKSVRYKYDRARTFHVSGGRLELDGVGGTLRFVPAK
jgi:hypothetical protein